MVYRFVHSVTLGEPSGSKFVEPAEGSRLAALEAAAEDVCEQLVVSIRPVFSIEWHDEQIASLQLLEHQCAIRSIAQQIGEFPINLAENRSVRYNGLQL